MSDFATEWSVDVVNRAAVHNSGFSLRFTGDPESSYFECTPETKGDDIHPHAMLRLIREGTSLYREQYRSQDNAQPKKSKPAVKVSVRRRPTLSRAAR